MIDLQEHMKRLSSRVQPVAGSRDGEVAMQQLQKQQQEEEDEESYDSH